MITHLITGLLFVAFVFADGPSMVTITFQNLFPYSLQYTGTTGFLVSSGGFGTVYQVADNGATTVFVQDPRLKDTMGIKYDSVGNQLLISSADPSHLHAALMKVDMATRQPTQYIDLTSLKRANYSGYLLPTSVTIDDLGNVYMIDSFMGVIWRINSKNEASIFATSPNWQTSGGQISSPIITLTGIEIINNQFLVVGCWGTLFKVPLDNPTSISVISVSEKLTKPEGFVVYPNGNLLLIDSNSVKELTSSDGWKSANVTLSFPLTIADPSSMCIRGESVFVLFSHFSSMSTGYNTFQIERIDAIQGFNSSAVSSSTPTNTVATTIPNSTKNTPIMTDSMSTTHIPIISSNPIATIPQTSTSLPISNSNGSFDIRNSSYTPTLLLALMSFAILLCI